MTQPVRPVPPTQRLLTERAEAAGFLFKARNYEPTSYFNVGRISTIADFATGGDIDPSRLGLWRLQDLQLPEPLEIGH